MHDISKELVGASSIPLILTILEEGENYGYMIIQRVKELTNAQIQWKDGTLYPILHKLERKGFIVSFWKEAENGRKRKYYKLKEQGKTALATEKQNWLGNESDFYECLEIEPPKFMKKLIEDWRARLYATGNFDHEELNELESHLLDELDQVAASTLNDEEKLLVAQHRLGSEVQLNRAYKSKGWISFTHLSWSLQMLMAFFLLREVVVLFSYISGNMIESLMLANVLLNYGIACGIQALGISFLFYFLRYILRLNYRNQSTVKPNLLMIGACALFFGVRVLYFIVGGNPIANFESLVVTRLLSYTPVILAFVMLSFASLRSWKKARKLSLNS